VKTFVLAIAIGICGAASSADAQSRVRIPASFYDIEIRESLTSGTSARMGGAAGMRASANPDRATGGFTVPEASGMSQFVVTADSMLFRSGRDRIELAVADFTSVQEVRAMGRADLAWVRIEYTKNGEAKEMFVRRYQVRNQAELLDVLQTVMDQHIARRAQSP
jgi:hypothetical protein